MENNNSKNESKYQNRNIPIEDKNVINTKYDCCLLVCHCIQKISQKIKNITKENKSKKDQDNIEKAQNELVYLTPKTFYKTDSDDFFNDDDQIKAIKNPPVAI
jgi:hypothetical protein